MGWMRGVMGMRSRRFLFWVTVSTPPIRSTRFHRSSHSLRRKRCWICRQHTLGSSFTAPAVITVDVATQSISRGSSDCHSNDLRDEALTCVGTAFAIPTIDRDKNQKKSSERMLGVWPSPKLVHILPSSRRSGLDSTSPAGGIGAFENAKRRCRSTLHNMHAELETIVRAKYQPVSM